MAEIREGTLTVAADQEDRLSALVLLLIGAVSLALYLGWRLHRRVIRQLDSVRAGVAKLGEGDLRHRLQVAGDSEFVDVAHAFNEMASRLDETQAELVRRSLHDSLTHLPNRMLFQDRVDHALARQSRADSTSPPHALLFIDLNDFKTVNDTLGHAAGDALLVTVADRLRGCLRPPDTVARLGGDEFAILLEDAAPGSAEAVARRVLDALHSPTDLDGEPVSSAASIGIAFSEVGLDVPGLLRRADTAMYAAKASGKAGYRVFDPSMMQDVSGGART